jgi:hypothetical protein
MTVECGRWAAAMKTLMGAWLLVLTACASAPQPLCIPPDATRTPEASGGFGPVPQADSGAAERYAQCKEREADERLEAQLREDEAHAKKREAEQLERELREIQGQDKQEPQPEPNGSRRINEN